MKRFTEHLVEADALRDLSARAVANAVWDGIQEIASNKKTIEKKVQVDQAGILFDLKKLKLSPVPLEVVFTARAYGQGRTGAFVRSENVPRIYIFRLQNPPNVVSLYDAMRWEEEKLRDTFVHEFIHHLDAIRMGSARWDKVLNSYPQPGAEADRDSYEEKYFNNPIEFNAFYQQSIDKLDVWLDDIVTERDKLDLSDIGAVSEFKKKIEFKTFDMFYDFVVDEFFPQEMIGALTTEYREKLKSRLYQHWTKFAFPIIQHVRLGL